MKRLRVLVLVHPELVPPDSLKGHSEQEINEWKTEYDVVSTLRASGHEVRPLGVENELKPIRDEIESWKPDVAFNLLEQFHGEAVYDQNVASYLELLRMPYTGCNPRGLVLSRGKDLSKTLPCSRCGARFAARRALPSHSSSKASTRTPPGASRRRQWSTAMTSLPSA